MARNTIPIRFNIANPRAEAEIKTLAGEMITNVSDDIKAAARAVIFDGYSRGAGPDSIALDLVGRINAATGHREGGVVGMTTPQAFAAINFRNRLESDDPAERKLVFGMSLRDRRFDPSILRAIEDEQPLPADMIDKMLGRYIDNAIALRGETIARTETGRAVMAAGHEAFAQGLEKTNYSPEAISKTWRSVGDNKVRDSHAELDGQTVVGLNTPFETDDGTQMLYPMDTSLGAGPEEIINCRCNVEYNIDFSEGLEPDTTRVGEADFTEDLSPNEVVLPVSEEFGIQDSNDPKDIRRSFREKFDVDFMKSETRTPSDELYVAAMKNTDKVLSDLVERHPDIGEAMSLNLNNIKLYAGDVLTDGTSVGRAGGGEISITAGKYAPLGVDLMILPPDNWVLRRDSFAGVLTHEMGHIVHNYVAQGAVEDGLVPTIGAFNGLLDRIAPTLSIYAQTNANEAAAEFFVLWSSKTRNTASALMRIDDWYRRYATIRRPLKVPLIASSEVYATIPPLPKDKYVEAMLKLYHIYNRILGRS